MVDLKRASSLTNKLVFNKKTQLFITRVIYFITNMDHTFENAIEQLYSLAFIVSLGKHIIDFICLYFGFNKYLFFTVFIFILFFISNYKHVSYKFGL